MSRNIKVFLDVNIGNKNGGKIILELFVDTAPRTCENFKRLCIGTNIGSYVGCNFFKIQKGFIIQSGDIIHNDGTGGKSIYGDTFNDESFTRRHTHAGLLSMANHGSNTNSSQFFITLKRNSQLDGKHVVFGQLVQGMELVRAIENIPTDKFDRPRVSIKIVGCGVLGAVEIRRNDPYTKHVEKTRELMYLVEKTDQSYKRNYQDNTQNNQKMLQNDDENDDSENEKRNFQKNIHFSALKIGLNALNHAVATQSGNYANSEDSSDSESSVEEQPISTHAGGNGTRRQKLLQLMQKKEQARRNNNKEIIEEKKRIADPAYESGNTKNSKNMYIPLPKEIIEEKKIKINKLNENQNINDNNRKDQKEHEEDDDSEQNKWKNKKTDPLNETAASVEWKDKKSKKKNSAEFGWDVFNVDSIYRAHKKRTANLELREQEYEQQKNAMKDEFYCSNEGLDFEPTTEAKNRLIEEIEEAKKKRKKFSRRRTHAEDESVSFISERNKIFNKKLDRAFGVYSFDVKQNLERGTAL